MGDGPRKWIETRWARRGRQVQFLTVSHWSPVPSSMPGMIRERDGWMDGWMVYCIINGLTITILWVNDDEHD